jgi:hypothetical protein
MKIGGESEPAQARDLFAAAVKRASTDEDWAELGRRFGACQRRSREIAGQGKGG